MRILLGSSEVHPYSKTGGLADMVGALALYLAASGHEVGVVTPLYASIRKKFPGLERLDWNLNLPLGAAWLAGEVWTLKPSPRLTIYFIHQEHLFDRPGIYQENGQTYADNAERFMFLSKAMVHLSRYLPWKPEIVHLHDWQLGPVPLLILDAAHRDGWTTPPRTCLTIHNLAYQGVFSRDTFQLANLPFEYFTDAGAAHFGDFNYLKTGLQFADALSTVSPTYAREITTPEFGCGLDTLLRHRHAELQGILNGVDYQEWNTSRNPHLVHPYDAEDLTGKHIAKEELQKQLGLQVSPDIPLFGNVSRLVDQKGSDLILAALEEMLSARMQFVLLGAGDPRLEEGFRELESRHPGIASVRIGYNHPLAHQIEAACDFFLMPSRFEPCGLNQMYSLRYGTLPIVRTTGGLQDSVIDPREDLDRADGIKFREPSVRALAWAIRKALALYDDPEAMVAFQRHAIAKDFSWERSIREYLGWYHHLLDRN